MTITVGDTTNPLVINPFSPAVERCKCSYCGIVNKITDETEDYHCSSCGAVLVL